MTIRPFSPTDTDALVRVFQKNVPKAFGESEVADFADFLRSNTDPYFVAEQDGRVLGACGYYVRPGEELARIVWIFSDPDAKGMGMGSALVQYMLDAIGRQTHIRSVECRTSQVAYRFFERFGFVLQYTKPDYWVPGLDLYYMTKSMT